jgi:hypothetical protein
VISLRNALRTPASLSATGVWPLLVAALAVFMALAGCGTGDREPEPEPEPSHTSQLNTIADAEEGERLVITASVVAVLSDRALVVHDVDLPEHGLLVLTPVVAATMRAPDLVMVDGLVQRFTFSAFQVPFALEEPAVYQPFEGRKALVAAEIRSFA